MSNGDATAAERMTVVVRVRPENARETSSTLNSTAVFTTEHNMVSVVNQANATHHRADAADDGDNKGDAASFVFDHVFGKLSTQIEVYEASAKACVGAAMAGINATVFAYGATSSGKTHTMIGNESHPGVMVLAMQDLFEHVRAHERDTQFRLRLSYLEVYNETLQDLLVDNSPSLQLRDDGAGGTVVAGLSFQEPRSADQVFAMLAAGNARRRQSPTDANAESSRSHAVLQITVEQQARTAAIETERRVAKLCMIDLAGSERAAATANRGQLMREGANINRSLLALGNCINVLCQGGSGHVPYRDSKLTRLLKDSLGGNCRTTMIATVSPSSFSIEDTLNTLRYANRAKNIKCTVQSNVVVARARVHEYGELISSLRTELAEWKARALAVEGSASTATAATSTASAAASASTAGGAAKALSKEYYVLHTQLRAALARHKAATAAIRQQNWRERALLTDAQSKQTLVGAWQKRVRTEQASGVEPMTPPQIMRARTDLDTLSRNLRESERERGELDQRVRDSAAALAQVSDSIKANVGNAIERTTLLQELEVGRAQEAAEAARDAATLAEQSERERANETKALGQRLLRALALIRRQQTALSTAGIACDNATANELLNDAICDSLAPPDPSEFAVTQAPPQTPRAYAKARPRVPMQQQEPQQRTTSTTSTSTTKRLFTGSSAAAAAAGNVEETMDNKRRRGGIMAETAAQRARNEAAAQSRRRLATTQQQQQHLQQQQHDARQLSWR
jgi:kinesin family protein 18/19